MLEVCSMLSVRSVVMDLFELKTAVDLLHGTERESDRQLRLTQLGELAGTIMHEINQPLGAIISSAEAALRWLDRDVPNVAAATRSIQRIRAIAGRSGRTIADLQLLSANILIDFTEQSLNSIVEEALQISKPQLALAEVATTICQDPARPVAKANMDLLLQVMLNVIQNAIDSVLEVSERKRTLSLRTFTSSESVIVEFEDNGVGLSQDPGVDLFDPLYTTKKGGMGLGLALCRRVMVAHGGSIQARPNSVYGATFAVSLPQVAPSRRCSDVVG
ncbi:sensor histidine kinase [Bradyrhizobium guangdongense]|uniref:sensor histidine kinase n=1 Tax=Bradyrhizobium guangdongense TaxID=1325090 RepID=UPI00131A14EA|nr:ATP-binding protein [Bradyrhizobium guangdongense]